MDRRLCVQRVNPWVIIFGIPLLVFCGNRVSGTDEKIVKKIESHIYNYVEKFELPGLAVGIMAENRILYSRGFGVENIHNSRPVTTATMFHLASDSKPFVATAIMQLVEQKKIELDAPVIKYLPYFKLHDKGYQEITIGQLLRHSSGLEDTNDYQFNQPQFDQEALERYVRSLGNKKLIFKPGEKFGYSNIGYEVLGNVIEKVAGMPFEDYIKHHIFDQLGMESSTFYMPEKMRDIRFMKSEYLPLGWASPHLRSLKLYVWEGYPYNRRHAPSTTLHSNAADMCKWALANLNKGKYRNNRILKAASYDLLWKPNLPNGWRTWRGYCGLSWFIDHYRNEKMIFHGGSDAGFVSSFVLLPDKKIAVVLCSNFQSAPLRAINDGILDILLGYEPKPPIPGAFIPVGRILAEKGVKEAARQWNRLKVKSGPGGSKYDFGQRQLGWAVMDMPGKKVEEALLLARFIRQVMPAFTKTAEDLVKRYKGDSGAARVMLKVWQESDLK